MIPLAMGSTPSIRFGTCSFTADGWQKAFYPPGMKASEYLSHYAENFDTVEIDSTFYRIPSVKTVHNWHAQTPDDFLFAAKVPQVVTHEKCLVEADADFKAFLDSMEPLKEKRGPLLLQFPYFNKKAFAKADDFMVRLAPFLKKLPKSGNHRFALEIRNKAWITPTFSSMLREHNVALAMIDHPWMARPSELMEKVDTITADFTYIRMLGDRYAIEEQTKTWDKVIVNRTRELHEWTEIGEKIQRRGVEIMMYVNNHFAGHAPATIRLLKEIWEKQTGKKLSKIPQKTALVEDLFSTKESK